MTEKEFIVTGMSCAACKANVEKAVGKLSGVASVNVNLLKENMVVLFDENTLTFEEIISSCTKIGYGASLKTQEKEKKSRKSEWEIRENKENENLGKMKNRLVYSILLLIPLMYIAMGSMLGLPQPEILTGTENILINILTQMLLTVAVIIINKKFFISGFKALSHRAPNMDSLVAIGSACSFIYGIIVFYYVAYGFGHGNLTLVHKYAHELYFESAAMILTLVTVGKFLETRSKRKTSDALKKLIELSPKTAVVLRDNVEVTVLAEDVVEGDILVIRPGESIAVDGIVIEGTGSVDQSSVTGESLPVEKSSGDKIISATVNKNGTFKMKATHVGNDTTLAKIIDLVDNASNTKAPIARLADKVSGVFVPVVIAIAVLTLVIWLLAGAEPSFALSMGITVLVISCPCALGLATPVAIMAGTGKAAENGILIKSAEALEVLSFTDTIILDKTGTVTSGKMSVTDVIVLDEKFTETEFLKYAYSLENGSEHPLSHAIKEKAVSSNLTFFDTENFKIYAGKGISATINNNEWISGNNKLLADYGINTSSFTDIEEKLKKEGKTTLIFAENKLPVGIIAISDTVKANAKTAISALKSLGKDVIILTGDNKETAKAVKEAVGADDFVAEVLPQDKEAFIKSLQKNNKKVAMVGDGINDSPALISADVGIAIGAGTDIAIDSADIVLMKSSLEDIVTAVELSKAVIKNIKINLFWAFFYNALGIPIASGVFYPIFALKLTPMLGSLAMSLSSLTVVSNALRLRFFKTNFTFLNDDNNNLKNIENINKNKEKEVKTMTKTIRVTGMMCPKCENHVKNALLTIDGVEEAFASHAENSATVTLSKDVPTELLIEAVIKEGYEAE